MQIANFDKLIEKNEERVPVYAVHSDTEIKGFFGPYRWLSNFYVAPVFFEGVMYRASENAYQAAKTRETSLRVLFQNCSPAESKEKGGKNGILQTSGNFRKDWETIKTDIMCAVVFDKFLRNNDLRRKLMDTGAKYLEESNHWGDVVWGAVRGEGENRLGKILMNVRAFWQKKP